MNYSKKKSKKFPILKGVKHLKDVAVKMSRIGMRPPPSFFKNENEIFEVSRTFEEMSSKSCTRVFGEVKAIDKNYWFLSSDFVNGRYGLIRCLMIHEDVIDIMAFIGMKLVFKARANHKGDKQLAKVNFKIDELSDGDIFADLWTCFCMAVMLENAPLEIHECPPVKNRNRFNCRYDPNNDLDIKIKRLDKNWYTESVQGNPFPVRGHFRWQPCGNGLKERKLIWIDEFMKEGYTKGAYMDDE